MTENLDPESRVTDETGKKIILALDVPDIEVAKEMIFQTRDFIGTYKIGLALTVSGGLGFAKLLSAHGIDVFLDLKLFDIKNTIADTVSRICDLGVSILTVHGDPYVIEAALEGREKAGVSKPDIYAVTVLTSLDMKDVTEAGYRFNSVDELTMYRTNIAYRAGADGVIASARECAKIKENFSRLKVITPGIRSANAEANDQKRTATPAEAVQAGADQIVVGREVTQAGSPLRAAEKIHTEMKAALNY